ncbi:MAG TPA: hypothetical protein VI913_03860 [Candidatus Peribacteraceae bacterium]|nr:hypothetical protein [Candidatus Peribacteraceae bacterium]
MARSFKVRKPLSLAIQVEGEPLDDKLVELLRGPDAKAGRDGAFDAVANGDDGVEVVEIDPSLDRTYALLAN